MTETDAGRTLGGRYELGEPLGTGGMAEVYCGRDTRLGRDVAIKLLRGELAGDPTFIARFRREAQAAASLNHPNIVSVYDTGEENGVPYIVMEYVEGRTLRDVLHSQERMTPQRALEIVADVCLALDYSHRAGIVHRDIKPGNVMLTREGVVKVMDFGIARAITNSTSTMTQTAAVIGTAQYLSPEQARGEHVDARSDIYSTGCLLYELLTRTPPFSGDSPVAVAYQHVREDPEVPSRRAPGLDAAIDAVVLKAMAKNPANRYQSAGEMRGDLLRAAAGRPVMATPILTAETTVLPQTPQTMVVGTTPPPERRPARTLAYALLALATLAVFVLVALLVRNLVSGDNKQFEVPRVVGLSLEEARAKLAEKGLEVGQVRQAFTEDERLARPGTILDQSPAPPIEVGKGAKVDLVVSRGLKTANIPANLVGMNVDDAKAALTAAGFKNVSVKTQDSPRPKDEVIASDPAPGSKVAYNSAVTLTVATGNNQIPNDLVNKPQQQVVDLLHQAGFMTINVQQVFNDKIPAGTVINVSPSPGSNAPVATQITLQVSQGPSPTPTPEPTESASSTPTESVPPEPTPTL